MTKEEAQLFLARWRLVNNTTAEEARSTPVSIKLQQLAMLFVAGGELGWVDKQKADESEVRARWVKLKEKAHG